MKNNTTKLFVFLLFCFCVILGINYVYQPFIKDFSNKTVVQEEKNEDSSEIEGEISLKQQFMNNMSARQKVAQIVAYPVKVKNETLDLSLNSTPSAEQIEQERTVSESTNATDLQSGAVLSQVEKELVEAQNLEWIKNNQPGFVTIFGEKIDKDSAKKAIEVIRQQYEQSGLLPIIATDHEGGMVQRLSGKDFTVLPSWKDVCESEEEKNKIIFNSSAQDLYEVGVNVVFAPVLDLANDNRVLKSRVCGDYTMALDTADLYIKTFSQYNVMPVIKHFPGIGKTTQDLHNKFEVVNIDLADSNAFKEILDLYPNIGLMTTHVGLKNVLEDTPCSLSSICLEKMTDLYPETLFFSDALEMKATGYDADVGGDKDLDEIAIDAVLAGNNVLVFGEGVNKEKFNQLISSLENEYNKSDIFRGKVDISLAKILLMKKVGE